MHVAEGFCMRTKNIKDFGKDMIEQIDPHSFYLDELVKNLESIDENPLKLQWILKEGLWYHKGSTALYSLCDLILVYYDGYGVPVELKGSKNGDKKSKARNQARAGRNFVVNVLGKQCSYGKIVFYDNKKYDFELVRFRDTCEKWR